MRHATGGTLPAPVVRKEFETPMNPLAKAANAAAALA